MLDKTYETNKMNTNNLRKKYLVQCCNCGGYGHVYKTCNHPVISYGIICYKSDYDDKTNSIYPNYLMVQRKDSLSYVEFIRGKYELNNREYILKLFSNMIEKERDKIKDNDFDYLWNLMWCRTTHLPEENTRNFNKEYKDAKSKFESIKKGIKMILINKDVIIFNLDYILKNTISEHEETEWGFPKGRRNINEDDLNCALREFREETGIPLKNIRICKNIKPLEEVYTGSNKIRYKHIYWIASYIPDDNLNINEDYSYYDPYNKIQAKEIKDVQWFNYKEAQDKIRNYNIERKELFKRLNSLIIKSIQNVI
jgi:8-oxo-dGTP pyrophosphatase MutT (NUDIX family)